MSPTPGNIDLTIPDCNEIITKEFIQRALKSEANGDPVPEILSHSVTLGTKLGDNFMSIIYSVDVELSDGKKRHLLIKCYPNHPLRQDYTNKTNVFFKEFEVYSKWIPELKRFQTEVLGLDKKDVVKLPYAPFVYGECIDFESEIGQSRMTERIHSLDNFIMMEDLRKTYGFRMMNRRAVEALDLDHMHLVIQALARMHSLSWVYRHHVEPDITRKFPCLVANLNDEELGTWNDLLYANLDQAIRIYDKMFGPGNECSAAAERFRGQIGTVWNFCLRKCSGDAFQPLLRVQKPDPIKFGKNAENPEPWHIICHGDCWSNNMLFRYDNTTGKPIEVVLVDLQMPQETCVVNDLQYVIYTCTRLKLRRSHLDELLQLYHDTFNNVCALSKTPTLPGFSMDSLRFRFHRSKFLGYYVATIVLPIMLKEEEKAVDMEEIEAGKDLTEAFAELCSDDGSNLIFKERIIELTQGLIEDGVF